jgi:hypothetical protein
MLEERRGVFMLMMKVADQGQARAVERSHRK